MLNSWITGIVRRVRGERRFRSRENAEKVQFTNRQYAAAVRLGRKLGSTPEELLVRQAHLLDEFESFHR